ncbi:MAG: hypothetical protein M8352_00375 [ANME-2 cluster archaeon]|nr:hypothetical protein [ANME-2 cluster archaeon]MDF1530763.1 hypothetical protein [ANME-2 cluster archaeon]
MVSECKMCHMPLGEEHPQLSEMCIDCFADEWGNLVEESPMASPSLLYISHDIRHCD